MATKIVDNNLIYGDHKIPLKYFDHFDVLISATSRLFDVRLWSKKNAKGKDFETCISLGYKNGEKVREVAKELFKTLAAFCHPFDFITSLTKKSDDGKSHPGFIFGLRQMDEEEFLQEEFLQEDSIVTLLKGFFTSDKFSFIKVHVHKLNQTHLVVIAKKVESDKLTKQINQIFKKLDKRFAHHPVLYELAEDENDKYPGLEAPWDIPLEGTEGKGTGKDRLFNISHEGKVTRTYWTFRKEVKTGDLPEDVAMTPSKRKDVDSSIDTIDKWLNKPLEDVSEVVDQTFKE